MPSSENRWIISRHRFHEHKTPDAARTELARLQAKFPKAKFRVYRIKRDVPDEKPAETAAAAE